MVYPREEEVRFTGSTHDFGRCDRVVGYVGKGRDVSPCNSYRILPGATLINVVSLTVHDV